MNAAAPRSPAVRTTCPYCGVGCGVLAQADATAGAAIAGDPTHPANFGRLCSKGAALGETVGLTGRLTHPMLRQSDGTLVRVPWSRALDHLADGLRKIIAREGPDAVAFYLSGQLLTEDYYVANKLMKGFIGSANVDTNSRLCMASTVAGQRRAFGADTVPGTYADLDLADLVVLAGSNAAWCHPVLFQRIMRNKTERGARIVVIDPRRTVTAQEADLFLAVAPGSDTALFCGLLVHLADHGALDRSYIETHTTGFAETLRRARAIAPDLAATARSCELAEADVAEFFTLFRAVARTVTAYSQGVNQSAQGTDKVNAIINCHLATGRIGRPGMGPLSLTGQPNAMGGREVGGLANALAAHMGFAGEEIERVRRFWNAPNMARREGRKAVDMFEAIGRGEIKALWVMASNPAVSLPRAGAMRDALKRLELFAVSENVLSNDTVNAGAQVLLPAAAWGEKDGTVTNSERRISRQRAFLPSPGECRPDWWIVSAVAQRLGFADAFAFASPADIFREHAALSAFENDGGRDFDIGGLAAISDDDYEALEPVQWPLRTGEKAGHAGEKRFFVAGGFFTPDRRARLVPPQPPALAEATSTAFAFRLNTGRIRDQWHTMTRSGQSPRLAAHLPEPFVEVHPQDAAHMGLADGGFARVSSQHGTAILKVLVTENQRPGSLFVPIHWSDETASCARVGELVSAHTDPLSGQPEAKATPATIAPIEFALRGFARARAALALPGGTWWAKVAVADGLEYRLATSRGPMFWHDFAHRWRAADASLAEALDGGIYRAAAVLDGHLDGCFYVSPADGAPQWDLADLAIAAKFEAPGRRIPKGQGCDYIGGTGAVVCACFGVSLGAVRAAVHAGAISVGDIGRTLRAGTHCGSCLPELKRIIVDERVAHPL
jgi:assimilatory nitrate reductase catalytic subunit